jgi:hypothetical protein
MVACMKREKGWHYVPDSAEGERCGVVGCSSPAKHKVEEVMPNENFKSIEDMLNSKYVIRHPLTTYLCCHHFSLLMGSTAREICDSARDG